MVNQNTLWCSTQWWRVMHSHWNIKMYLPLYTFTHAPNRFQSLIFGFRKSKSLQIQPLVFQLHAATPLDISQIWIKCCPSTNTIFSCYDRLWSLCILQDMYFYLCLYKGDTSCWSVKIRQVFGFDDIGKRVMSQHCNACLYIVNQDLRDLTLEYKIITRTLQEHCKAVLRLWELKIGGNAMSWHHPFADGSSGREVERSGPRCRCSVQNSGNLPDTSAIAGAIPSITSSIFAAGAI